MRGLGIVLALGSTLGLGGCVGYQSRAAPAQPPVLPVGTPLWIGPFVDVEVHRAMVEDVVAASGTCKPPAPGLAGGSQLRLHVSDASRTNAVSEFLCGITLTTFPFIQYRDLIVSGDAVDDDGVVLAHAQASSTVGVLFGWPLVFVPHLWSDLDATDLVRSNVRTLTRHVLGELVLACQALEAQRLPPAPDSGAPTIPETGQDSTSPEASSGEGRK